MEIKSLGVIKTT